MKLHRTWMTLMLACLWPVAAFAQVQLVPDKELQQVFAGEARQIAVVWHNDGDQNFTGEIRARVLQASSATVAQVNETPWKKLQVLPKQTALESAQLDFPAVKAETMFLVQWLVESNRVIGTTEVWVYPTNLLAELKPMLGEATLGVLDPDNELKPLLRQNGVAFVDLGESALEDFSGKLAIVGPFQAKTQMHSGLSGQIKALAKKNVAVVWLLPPPEKRAKPVPSFYSVVSGTNAVVVAPAEMVARLQENPQAQMNLVYFCKLALHPHPPVLPEADADSQR